MFGAAVPLAISAAATTPLLLPFIKATSELHRLYFPSDLLARQGQSVPSQPGLGKKLARQRASGVQGNSITPRRSGQKSDTKDPGYLGKVPSRNVVGDLRGDYDVGGKGNATSSQGNIDDILMKVPDRGSYGCKDYRRIARQKPRRDFDNQRFGG